MTIGKIFTSLAFNVHLGLKVRLLFNTAAFTKLQAVIAVAIFAAIAVSNVYYYRGLTISGPTPSPSPTLIPLPYDAFDFYPEPNSTNVSTDTNITVYLSRPPAFSCCSCFHL